MRRVVDHAKGAYLAGGDLLVLGVDLARAGKMLSEADAVIRGSRDYRAALSEYEKLMTIYNAACNPTR